MHCHVVMLIFVTSPWLAFKARAAPTKASGYFWHITDFHLDRNYSLSGNAKKMCWETGDNSAMPAGIFGDYKCDSPYKLVESAMSAMKKFGQDPDFILWTGDDKAHVKDDFFSEEIVLELISNLTTTIQNTFPQVPIVPVLGNHDWFPTHQLPGHAHPLYESIGDIWAEWLGKDGKKTFLEGGYYSTKVTASQIVFLVLNTALYYQKNKENSADPGGQFSWMEEQLKEARTSKQKVFITSHVPPGVFERHYDPNGWTWLKERYNKQYVELIVSYSDVISGQFFAHHHTDSFRIFYNEIGLPVSWLLVAPAVTPWNTTLSGVGPNNPGLRLFFYDISTKEIDTFHQYYLNLSSANSEANDTWKLEYNLKEAFNLSDGITPQSLNELVSSFNRTDRALFDRYYLFNSVSYQAASDCDENCRQYQLCAITNVHYEAFHKCYNNTWSEINEPIVSEQKSDNAGSTICFCLRPGNLAFFIVAMIIFINNLTSPY